MNRAEIKRNFEGAAGKPRWKPYISEDHAQAYVRKVKIKKNVRITRVPLIYTHQYAQLQARNGTYM